MKRSFKHSRHSLIGMFLLGIAVFFCLRPADLYAAGPTPDSFTTTSYSSLPSNAMSAMAYGNNVYIAVGYYGAIIKSADAETWVNVKTKADINYTGVTAPGSFTFNGAAYGNGLFVVTGSEGVILTSPDGNTWTQRSSGVTTGIWSTEFLTFNGNSAFYATTQGKLLTSPDGINWTTIVPTGVDSSLTLTKVTVGNGGTRLAVGGANGRIYSTTNGTAWTSAQPSTAEGQSIGTNMVTWMNDRYYISDPRAYIWTSTDLSTFTLLGPPFKQNASQHNNQMFNGFYDGTKYYMFGYESPNYGAVYTSTNGTTWTMQPFKNYFVTQNARYLNGKYFRLGNEGMLVSSDGADWRYKWGGAFTEIVHGSGSQYVAVGKTGGDGAIWNSADLAHWNEVTLSPRTTGFNAAAYGNNTYVAVGETNQTTTALATSPDGTTWTLRSGINDSTTLSDIAFGNGKFVAVGSGAGGPKIKTSEDGISWHEPALPVQPIDAVYSIAYTNNQFIALGYGYSDEGYLNAASIWTSADGETWSNRSGAYPNQTDGFNNLLYDGSKYVLTGYDSSTYEVFSRSSEDLTTWSSPTLTGTYTYFSSSAMLGQKGNNLYMLAYDSSNTPVVYYTADHGSTWQNAGVDMSSIDPNAIYSLMEADGRVLLSGNSQLVMTTTGILAQVEAPTANPAGGAVAPGTTVALSSATNGAAIHYTLDGSVPTSSSPVYSGPIPVTSAVTIKAIAVKAGMTDSAVVSEAYTIMAQVEAPIANPAGGAVAPGTTVVLSSATSGAVIHYTLDGSVPTSSSPEYSGPIPVTGAVTIKAIAVKAGMTDSAVMSEAYTIMAQVEAPTATPAGGAVAPGTTVALSSATSGAAIHYTLDGSVPTSSSPEYSGPIPVTEAVTIKAIAVKAGMTNSAVMSEAYTIMAQVEAPTANPAGGAVAPGTTVALSSATSGAVIHYTLDGSVPTSGSPVYSGPIPVTGAVTIKAIAVKAGMTDSAVMSEAYTIMAQVEAPTANPAGGAVAPGTTVALSSATGGAAIHYTLDGSVPTSGSPVYSGPIPVTGAVTIKAIAVKAGMTDSAVMSEAYTIMAQVEAPTAKPAGGAVAPGTTVALSSATGGAAIHYTLDGSVPTSSSPEYSGPIPVTSAVTIKAIAVKAGMTDSAVMSEAYMIMAQVEAPTANPAGGAVASGTTVALSSATGGAAIHYTLDGSVPTSSSPVYSGPILVTSAVTIKAIAVKAGMTDSAVMSEAYTIMAQVEAPTANPAGGAVAPGTTVALSSATGGAAIHYTLDGSVPTSSSPVYSGPILVTSAVTIKAIAVKTGMTDSAVLSEAYTLSTEPELDSIISPVSAAFDKKQTQQADVTIELTLNGNTLIGISNGIANLTAGTDYTLAGSTVTISKTYLASLAAGTTSLTFRFSAGAAQTLDIRITDTTVPIPGVPLLQSAVFGNAQVQLIWTPVEGSTGYKIFQRLADTEYGSEVATVSGSVYSYNAVNLLNGTTYYFVVKAANAEGDSAASNELSATPKTAPGAPSNVTAGSGNGQAVVSFTAPDSDGGSPITGYEVTSSPGNIVAYGTASPITVTGLTNGTAYTFTVKAINSAGSSTTSALSNTVTPIAPSSGGGDTPPSVPVAPATPAAPPAVTGFNVLVNGKVENAGTITTATVNGQTALTVAIDQAKLEEKLAAEGQGAVVTIPVTVKSDIVIAELNGQMVKEMEDKQAVLELKSENATYTLPAGQINMDAIRSQFGTAVALGDIKVKLEIAAPAEDTLRTVENSAVQGGFTLVAPPLNFVVRAEYGGQTVEISKFSAYVERQIALPDGVDPNKITTAIVVEPNGSVRHVPTRVTIMDQKYYAKVNSLTNSTYSIIWHPLEFKDVAGHWAKDIVNNMGSRMIIDGTGNGLFNPDAEITRAEFAAVIVRGLGLKLDSSAASFADVKAEAWYSSAVQTAYAYHLINGFEDGTFRPADKITREQAMAIIAKAMKLTSLKDKLPVQSSAELLSPFKDASKISPWAQSGAADSIEAGIVSGRSASELAPQAYITRAEVAAIVQRLLQKSNLI
ncbi:chitobiase/beta-hexosaminidase C-terminal domain-containing protein [Paenibacillus riograndensis]|uniref:chitobiase/beta-hexosaminidase C-terminal domain-containing protein n=1 Tax=Paenibacillus riograndensis TaxID=483937 RepID=UPI0007648213|nr:chitobiase/beta-hexosaminidase C-terminal domain-containing protein [Paenibacillus riograndensis]